MIRYWPRCPLCGAYVDCIGRPENDPESVFRFRCKRWRNPSSAAPRNGHVFTLTSEELEEGQPALKAALEADRGRVARRAHPLVIVAFAVAFTVAAASALAALFDHRWLISLSGIVCALIALAYIQREKGKL